METLESTQPAAQLTPPAVGEYWPGQGGIYVGTLPAFDGLPARHMIASAIEAPNRLTWGPYDDVPGATSRTNGQANTAAILAHAASTGQKFPAAAWAHAHTADGHTDFHLPSQAELFLASLYAPQVFGKESWYWTSTQHSRSSAFVQDFEHGGSNWSFKVGGYRVRAVRWIQAL